jgi:hypothetical protein
MRTSLQGQKHAANNPENGMSLEPVSHAGEEQLQCHHESRLHHERLATMLWKTIYFIITVSQDTVLAIRYTDSYLSICC